MVMDDNKMGEIRSAILSDDGVVENVIVGLIEGLSIECGPEVCIGWLYTDGVFSPPPPEQEETSPELEYKPITPRQIRLALASIGISEAHVEAHLVDNPQGLIEWRFATSYERDHPLVIALAESFELGPHEVDALWSWTAEL